MKRTRILASTSLLTVSAFLISTAINVHFSPKAQADDWINMPISKEVWKAAQSAVTETVKKYADQAGAFIGGFYGAQVAAGVLGVEPASMAAALAGGIPGAIIGSTVATNGYIAAEILADYSKGWVQNAYYEVWGLTYNPSNYEYYTVTYRELYVDPCQYPGFCAIMGGKPAEPGTQPVSEYFPRGIDRNQVLLPSY